MLNLRSKLEYVCTCFLLGGVLYLPVFAAKPVQHERFIGLLKELRCLVCQNQDLADSHAPLANRLREEVQRLMSEGKTDQEIRMYLSSRYGDFILFKPPLKPSTALLWFGPGLFLLIGLIGVGIFVNRGRRRV